MSPLAERVLAGEVRAVARAATLIENRSPQALPLLAELFPYTGKASIWGITGPPGAGKSTLAGAIAGQLRREQIPVGIVAVDPSSPFSGGAILGDRIRMLDHYADPGVFVRSMATRGVLGGLARATLDMALLLDAAGRKAVLIETVGAGQAEVDIARLADVTCVVLVPGMGDDVQAIKAGIIEIADVFVINKADRPGASQLEQELRSALALSPQRAATPIVATVASERTGIPELVAAIRAAAAGTQRDPVRLWQERLREMLRERLLESIPESEFASEAARVAARDADPYSVIAGWIRRINPGL